MSAPLLKSYEQRAAISGKKKKKKTVKNVLGIPDCFKVECSLVKVNEVNKLHEILNRLLPSAKLPLQKNLKSKSDSLKQTEKELELKEKIKSKRNQLLLGVNVLSKNLKKNSVSAVILANDIHPKFLINHLNLMCAHNKIPFLCIPELRKITAVNLGFPCIAMGFKKDSCDFLEAVEEIKSVYDTIKMNSENKNHKVEVMSRESDDSQVSNDTSEVSNDKISEKLDETTFVYLYRTSVKERKFIPEIENSNVVKNRTETDFISMNIKNNKTDCKNTTSRLGISSNLIRKQLMKEKKLQCFVSNNFCEEEEGENEEEEEDLEPPKKKIKKHWLIDKVGTKQNFKYHPAKLHKIFSNINRNSKKK